jgi:hypothetical protein
MTKMNDIKVYLITYFAMNTKDSETKRIKQSCFMAPLPPTMAQAEGNLNSKISSIQQQIALV